MARCDTCGNDYNKTFEVMLAGKTHTFDCFQCAIQALAPSCGHCGCTIIGQGLEFNGVYYCSRHCTRKALNAEDFQQACERADTVST